MEDGSPIETRPAKKRRIPKACSACRAKKLACDERRPCARCSKAGVECVYHERPKDPRMYRAIISLAIGLELTGVIPPDLERIERIESQLDRLNQRLDSSSIYADIQASPSISHSLSSIPTDPDANVPFGWQNGPGPPLQASNLPAGARSTSVPAAKSNGHLIDFEVRQSSSIDVVSAGSVLEADARLWFSAFFEGCDRFVPVFDPATDTFDSIRARNNTLFDIILIFGARATYGVLSRPHQRLYNLLREHTSDLVLRLADCTHSNVTLEDIQALLVIASYSDSGGILCDVALRASVQYGLPEKLDSLFSLVASHALQSSPMNRSLFVAARIWYYLFVLDIILSIDGGKPPSISMLTSPRRVRSLLHHPQRTALDLRLFAQVELNALRANAHAIFGLHRGSNHLDLSKNAAVSGAILDLDLWLSEWEAIVLSDANISSEHSIMSLNLRIQHQWALLTLHLRALTASGIENIALMTVTQRNIALSAKRAAEKHLQLLLSDVSVDTTPGGINTMTPYRPYVSNFMYAMEFVWAKNAFCVLIVLRLGILLGDSADHLTQRLAEAKEFLRELDKIGMGANTSYTRILAQTVQKCEKAINSSLQSGSEHSSSEPGDFQTFIPKEFMFAWDFPGLNLCYIPLDWQDLFLDFGATT